MSWMLSNGNILFTRMQYIAEITPEKKVVWRYDAAPGTEIHACQLIGTDKVLFIVNGLPPRLMVVNIKTNVVEVAMRCLRGAGPIRRPSMGSFGGSGIRPAEPTWYPSSQ
jgi:hypothetical protein